MPKIILLLAILALTSVGCAAAIRNPTAAEFHTERPSLGEVKIAYVGDALLTVNDGVQAPGVKLLMPITSNQWRIEAGEYVAHVKDEDGRPFFTIPSSKTRWAPPAIWFGSQKDNPPHGFWWEPGRICVQHMRRACQDLSLKVKPVAIEDFDRRLLYSGRSGSRLTLSYREFTNDRARPAFTHNAEFDLSKSRTVGYKGARIKILGVSNEAIKYRVERSFQSAEAASDYPASIAPSGE